jgi:tetratricopeptide (TPR) repeat protein
MQRHFSTAKIFLLLSLLLSASAPRSLAQLPNKSVAPAQQPHNAEGYFKRGVALYQQGDLDGAGRAFERATELAQALAPVASAGNNIGTIVPEAAVLFYNRAIVYYDRRAWDDALLDLNHALDLDPHHVNAWIKLGNTHLQRGDLDAAISDFAQAIRLDPRAVLAWNNRGLARQHKGELDAALSDYARALELDPRLPAALNNRAGIKHERGDLRGALSDYDQAIALAPGLALVYNNRGVTRKALGDLKGAIADYSAAIRLRPNFSPAYFNRSAAWKALGKGVEAGQDFMRSQAPGEAPEALLQPPLDRLPANKP